MPEKLVTFDREFVQALEQDPEKALKELGLEPTREAIDMLREMDFKSLYELADAYSKVSPEGVKAMFP